MSPPTPSDESLAPYAASHELLRTSLSLLPLGVIILDADGIVLLAEGGALSDLGFEGELSGRRLEEQAHLAGWFAHGVAEARSGRDVRATGSAANGRLFEADFRPTRSADGAVRSIIGSVHEVSSAVARAERLRTAALRRQFEQLADLAEWIYWEADIETLQFRYVSESSERLLGYPIDQWHERGFWEAHLHPEDRERTVASCARAANERRPHQLEYRMLRADGREVWMRDFVTIDSAKDRLRGVIIDITELKSTYEELGRANALLEASLEATGDGVLGVGLSGDVQRWNARFAGMWSLDLDAAWPVSVDALFANMKPFALEPDLMAAVRHQILHPDEQRRSDVRLRDGRILEWLSVPQRQESAVTGQVWTFRDVTVERKAEEDSTQRLAAEQRARAEAERRAAQAAFLAEASRKLATSLDFEATVRTVTHIAVPQFADGTAWFLFERGEFRQVTVVHRDPELQRIASELFTRYPPDPNAEVGMGRLMRTGEVVFLPKVTDDFVKQLARSEEHLQLLRALKMKSYLAVPILGIEGRMGAMAFATLDRTFDESDLETAEELGRRCGSALDHAQMYQQTQKAIRLRDDFLGIASHELKTPLTPLKLLLKSLENRLTGVDESLASVVRRAERSVERLTSLVSDLLDVTQLEAGQLVLHPERVSFDELVRRVAEEFRELSARHTLDLSGVYSAAVLDADPLRLGQVVANLFDNAIKYSPEGGAVTVATWQERGTALLRVTDTGIGIPRAQQPHVFERFFRASSAPRTRYGGLGLGLYICRNVVERHGGRIWFESEEGKGTSFYVALPISRPD